MLDGKGLDANGEMERWRDGRIHGRTDGRDGWIDGCMDARVCGRMKGWMRREDGWSKTDERMRYWMHGWREEGGGRECSYVGVLSAFGTLVL